MVKDRHTEGRIPTSSSTSSGVKPKALSSARVGPGVYNAAATCLSFFADTHQLFGVGQTDAVERARVVLKKDNNVLAVKLVRQRPPSTISMR